MSESYYVARGEKKLGMYSKEQVLTLYNAGSLLPSDTWYSEPNKNWLPLPPLIQSLSASKVTPPDPVPNSVWNRPVNAGLITVVLVILAAVLMMIHSASLPAAPDSDSFKAWSVAQEIIKKHLKAPSTAKFSETGDSDTFHQRRKDGDFYVGGFVDSQNSFGAMLRAKWAMVIHDNGNGDYSARWYSLGDDDSGDYPKDE